MMQLSLSLCHPFFSFSLLAPSLQVICFLFHFFSVTPAGTAVATAILEVMAELHFVLVNWLVRKIQNDAGMNLKLCASLLPCWWGILPFWVGKLTPTKSLKSRHHSLTASLESNSWQNNLTSSTWESDLSPLVQTFLRKSLHTLTSPFFPSPFPPPSSAILSLDLLTLKVQKCCLSCHSPLLQSTLFHSVLCSEQFSLSQSSDFHVTFLVETSMYGLFLLVQTSKCRDHCSSRACCATRSP